MLNKYIANLSPQWIENMYHLWIAKPDSVDKQWQLFFSGFELAKSDADTNSDNHIDEAFAMKVSGVQSLIFRYRSLGHLLACTDPLTPCHTNHTLLELNNFGLDDNDLPRTFPTRRFGKGGETLSQVIETLRTTYCREIGIEFMHIEEPEERQWLIDRMEPCLNRSLVSQHEQLHFLHKLNEANLFETFLQRRFPGQKRFSLEGGESLVAGLDVLARACPANSVNEIVIGMAHRGRLNVLAHIFGKPYQNIFAEFRDDIDFGFAGDGDVKYHKGYSTDLNLPDGKLHITLAPNPSHLEAVNSVVEGKCRARQDRNGCLRLSTLPLLIHGDAALSGQGSNMEIFTMSQLAGYSTGGTIHIVLNNQIGFTTLPGDSRSTRYSTDVAKMLSCPIFHVQGESPEALRHVILLALSYRQKFARDVVVEIICYRRHGHNEADEPMFTQPIMYGKIAQRPPVNRIYADKLISSTSVSPQLIEQSVLKIQSKLEEAFIAPPLPVSVGFKDKWQTVSSQYSTEPVNTKVSPENLLLLARRLAELPPGFTPHPKIEALLQKRFETVLKGGNVDWGTAESLAFASLLSEGISVRISGEDSRRGTFSHRHSFIFDQHDQHTAVPLSSVALAGAKFQVWDSPLSEFGVLGFEYGYSLESPDMLIIWEAQFGDFANGAQVIIDQFISSGESKWNRASGLVMLLPHGYEGQGGEHSSARIERFLQLCANNNLQIANPSTPSQLFHLLRRQLKQDFRKPLVVFTPKSLLRHPDCVSPVTSLNNGAFNPVIDDELPPNQVTRILFCSGKIYYDLKAERDNRSDNLTAIIRIEQLYPFPDYVLSGIVSAYPKGVKTLWVQEEPKNMGAWSFVQPYFYELFQDIQYIGRPADSSPAVGSHAIHLEQQTNLIVQAFSK